MNNLLENKHNIYLYWDEPRPSCNPEGYDLTACITLKATVHDCINMQRLMAKNQGRPANGSDGNLLKEFMLINYVYEKRGSSQ